MHIRIYYQNLKLLLFLSKQTVGRRFSWLYVCERNKMQYQEFHNITTLSPFDLVWKYDVDL